MRAFVLLLTCFTLGGCVAWHATGVDSAATIATPPERQIVITVRNSPTRTALNVGSTARGYDAAGRYQVSPAALRDVAAIAQRYGLRQVAAWPIEVLSVHCIVFEVPGDRPLDAVLLQIAADPRVESAQPLRSFRTQTGTRTTALYDDPYFGLQANLTAMQVEEAHRWSRGRGVRVAVIDSGVDDLHPDLAHRVVLERDLTGLAAATGRLENHGTAVAGVIAADAGNGQGIVGIAPEASVLALRACWQVIASAHDAGGSRCNTFTLAQALTLAISERADVINMSLSGPPDPLLERLVQRALAMGKVVVGAVPEDIQDAARDSFPASLPGVLAVASAEVGKASNDVELLYAPGRNVLTLRPAARYDFEDGSSMAAANVSGVVALLLAVKRNLTTAEIRALLQNAAPHPQPVRVATERIVNACEALAALAGGGDCASVKRMHAVRQ